MNAAHVSLVGEDRERTRIEFAELRRNWRASHPDDWGAAVINIGPQVTDLVHRQPDRAQRLRRRTRRPRSPVRHPLRRRRHAHRHPARDACSADGGDTLSLWNAPAASATTPTASFEGCVDFVCPRGWAYVTNSRFFGHNLTASIWHDGSKDARPEAGRAPLALRRRARLPAGPQPPRRPVLPARRARSPPNMADRPIYPAPAPDPRRWGERYYYSDCRRDGAGGDFAWFARQPGTPPRARRARRTSRPPGRSAGAGIPRPRCRPCCPSRPCRVPTDGWRWADPAGVTLRWTPGRNATRGARPLRRGGSAAAARGAGGAARSTRARW